MMMAVVLSHTIILPGSRTHPHTYKHTYINAIIFTTHYVITRCQFHKGRKAPRFMSTASYEIEYITRSYTVTIANNCFKIQFFHPDLLFVLSKIARKLIYIIFVLLLLPVIATIKMNLFNIIQTDGLNCLLFIVHAFFTHSLSFTQLIILRFLSFFGHR